MVTETTLKINATKTTRRITHLKNILRQETVYNIERNKVKLYPIYTAS